MDLDWIWTETGLVSDLPVGFRLDWSSSGLWVKCDVSVQYFGQNITKHTANCYFTIATSPYSVQIQSDWVPIWSSSIRILSQSTSIRCIQIQSKFCPNPIMWTHLQRPWWRQDLVPSSLHTRLRRGGEDHGELKWNFNQFLLDACLKNNDIGTACTWIPDFVFRHAKGTRVEVNPLQVNMRCRCCCKFIANNTIIYFKRKLCGEILKKVETVRWKCRQRLKHCIFVDR